MHITTTKAMMTTLATTIDLIQSSLCDVDDGGPVHTGLQYVPEFAGAPGTVLREVPGASGTVYESFQGHRVQF